MTSAAQLPFFQLAEVVHDVNSLFRCLSYINYGNQNSVSEVRRKINKHILIHWDRFKDIVVDHLNRPFQSKSGFKKSSGRPRCSGLPDVMAASEVYERPIHVHAGKDMTYIGQTQETAPIHLRFTSDDFFGFYDVLEPRLKPRAEPSCQSYSAAAALRPQIAFSSATAFGAVRPRSVPVGTSGPTSEPSVAADGTSSAGAPQRRAAETPQGGGGRPANNQRPQSLSRNSANGYDSNGARNEFDELMNSQFTTPLRNKYAPLAQLDGRDNSPPSLLCRRPWERPKQVRVPHRPKHKQPGRPYRTAVRSEDRQLKQAHEVKDKDNGNVHAEIKVNNNNSDKFVNNSNYTEIIPHKEGTLSPIKEVEIPGTDGKVTYFPLMSIGAPCLEDLDELDDDTVLVSLISVLIFGTLLKALADSGAVVNCISYSALMRAFPDAVIKHTDRGLVTVNKQPLKTYGIWTGTFEIGNISFQSSFYVCKGISHDMILGNRFLLKARSKICYDTLTATFKNKSATCTVEFGIFYRPNKSVAAIGDMDVEGLYSGPSLINSTKEVTIQPKTIAWIEVQVIPHNIQEETVFIGNPNLFKNQNLLVSDFILSPNAKHYIQVTNIDKSPQVVKTSYNLAVDDSYASIFHIPTYQTHHLEMGAEVEPNFEISEIMEQENNLIKKKQKFNICPDVGPKFLPRAETLLQSYSDCFVSDVSELRTCNYPPVKIPYDDSKIIRQKNYRLSPDDAEFLNDYIDKLLEADLVEYCTSVYCSPVLVIPKQTFDENGVRQKRCVLDYRKVNKILKPMRYPVPDTQELIDSFQGKYWHSVTDNCSGYSQLRLHKSSRPVFAFDSPSGSRLQWKILPQGASVSPAIYCLVMDRLLSDLKRKKLLVNYFDDTHIGTESIEEHFAALKEYFDLLRHHGIKLNINKSKFFYRKVQFLGVEIDGTNAYISEKRVRAIRKMPIPKNKDNLRTALGVFSYNRRFIQSYSKVTAPLQKMLKKDEPFVWETPQETAFAHVKTVLSNPPALRLYDPKLNNRICTDASILGLGVSYYQKCPKTNRYCPIGFASRTLRASERKLPVYYLEFNAVVYAFIHFRCYLQNRNVECEVLTDHKSLVSLFKTANPQGSFAQNLIYLSQFKFAISYRKGSTHLDADSLSRNPVPNSDDKTVDELVESYFGDRILPNNPSGNITSTPKIRVPEIKGAPLDDCRATVPDDLKLNTIANIRTNADNSAAEATGDNNTDEPTSCSPVNNTIQAVMTRAQSKQEELTKRQAKELDNQNKNHANSTPDLHLFSDSSLIRSLQNQDDKLVAIMKNLSDNATAANCQGYIIRDNLLYLNKDNKILLVVPKCCRKYVLQEFHDNRGHRATKHLAKNISDQFWWHGLHSDAEIYYLSCRYCMMNKPAKDKIGFLNPVIPSEHQQPFSHISCDFIGAFKASKRKNTHAALFVDHLTKYVWTKAVRVADTESAIACLTEFSMLFGLCKSYTTDSASYFTSFAFEEVLKRWNVTHNAFRKCPHAVGQAERSVQSVKNILASLLLQFEDEWDTQLPLTTFIYNVNYHDTIKCSPFRALYNYRPITPGINQWIPVEGSKNLAEHLGKHADLLRNLEVRISKSQERYKRYHDKGRKHIEFKIGQYVRVRQEKTQLAFPRKKIRFRGPFKVIARLSQLFYLVLIPTKTSTGKKKFVAKEYHIRHMRPYVKRPEHLRPPRLSDVTINNIDQTVRCPQPGDITPDAVESFSKIGSHSSQDYNSSKRIKHVAENLFSAPTKYALGHCISSDAACSAGIAKTFQKYFDIKSLLATEQTDVGTAVRTVYNSLHEKRARVIYNLVTKFHHAAKPNEFNIRRSLKSLKGQMLANNEMYLAIPALASGLDRQKLPDIVDLIEEIFKDTAIDIVMYHPPESHGMKLYCNINESAPE